MGGWLVGGCAARMAAIHAVAQERDPPGGGGVIFRADCLWASRRSLPAMRQACDLWP